MRRSEIRIRKDIAYAMTNSFISLCKKIKENHFTRHRKMPLGELLLSILNRKGLTLVMELRNFFKNIKKDSDISKVGYLKQRMKLNSEAFLDLNNFHTKNFYDDTHYLKTMNGYLILAADGSGINIPTTEKTIEMYGTSSRKGTKPQASLGLSCMYDVMNKMIIDCTINRCKFDEPGQAEKHLEKLTSIIGEKKYVLLLDRGYPSSPFFIRQIAAGRKFLVRLKSVDFKQEQASMTTTDELMNIVFTKSRLHHYQGTPIGEKMQEIQSITLRLVKVSLSSGIEECLATNLSPEEFTPEEIVQLYTMRWGIETAYDMLKNKLEIENFTGTKPILLEQDIYSCVYLCNLMQDIILDAEDEAKEKNHGKYKHPMEINRSLAIGILKEDLLQFILVNDTKKKTEIFEKILAEIQKNLIPIRSDRHFKRTDGQLAGKYSNTHKRSY